MRSSSLYSCCLVSREKAARCLRAIPALFVLAGIDQEDTVPAGIDQEDTAVPSYPIPQTAVNGNERSGVKSFRIITIDDTSTGWGYRALPAQKHEFAAEARA